MANASTPIHVAFALDRQFLSYTAVAAASAAMATKGLHVHILHGGDLGQGYENLSRLIEYHGGRSHFYQIDLSKLPDLPVSGHVSLATYYRLSIAELLPREIPRIIYLDGDVIVRQSLADLYAVQTNSTGVAAVPEPHPSANERLGLSVDTAYLNAGVLVLDLDHWRQSSLSEHLYEIAAKNVCRLRFWDQDILALYLEGNFTHLSSQWNVHHRYFFGENRLPWPATEPAIVHFSGAGLKPPDYKVLHPYGDEFWALLRHVSRFGLKQSNQVSWTILVKRLRLWRTRSRLRGLNQESATSNLFKAA